jgi:LCP family protein required for cell wall assembly
MSNRPPDPPEFDWLYGSQKPPMAPAPADADEPTRVINRVAGRVSPPPPPPLPPRPAPSGGSRGSGGISVPLPGRPKILRNLLRLRLVLFLLPLLLLAWVAFLIAVPTIAWNNVTKVNAFPSSGRPADQPGETYLLVGSDSRKGLSKAENRKLGTGGVGVDGGRTDTIMLLHIGDEKPLLLSIPRDSLVPIPGHGVNKINAAFAYGGPKLLVQTIEQDTGVRIDHYVEIGFGGFVNAVDAVNGITICPTKDLKDRRANLNVKKGCQQVSGVTALAYARSRHSDPVLGDITRARHQREVVSAIGAKVKSIWSVLNPWRYSNLINAATTSLTVSDGTGVIDMAKFAKAMTEVNGTSGLTCSMPIRDLAVHWDHVRALALMALIKTDQTNQVTKTLCEPTGLKS